MGELRASELQVIDSGWIIFVELGKVKGFGSDENGLKWIRKSESSGRETALIQEMNTDLNEALSERVIGAIFEVSNTLGGGFLEKVYERALMKELRLRGIRAEAQAPMEVSYKGENVGIYLADLVVEGELVVELKCTERLGADRMAQCMNYLRASGRDVCLLVNFQNPRMEWKRILRPVKSFGSDENGSNQWLPTTQVLRGIRTGPIEQFAALRSANAFSNFVNGDVPAAGA
jgi:GxxExxY protein